jgi:hypothetical protein
MLERGEVTGDHAPSETLARLSQAVTASKERLDRLRPLSPQAVAKPPCFRRSLLDSAAFEELWVRFAGFALLHGLISAILGRLKNQRQMLSSSEAHCGASAETSDRCSA